MPLATPETIFREGLLDGRAIVVAGTGARAATLGSTCAALGARVTAIDKGVDPLDEDAVTEAVEEAARSEGGIAAVIVDAGGWFADGGPGPLVDASRAAWNATRAAANAAMIEAGEGRAILVAPAIDAGPHARAEQAAMENLARTLSIEWSRYRICVTAVLPGPAERGDGDVVALVAYLASEAGDFASGCAFDLGGSGANR
jgi:NAD(P)-dependent dehydrogenase (short-subunit alcohol dehydrogenase family)